MVPGEIAGLRNGEFVMDGVPGDYRDKVADRLRSYECCNIKLYSILNSGGN